MIVALTILVISRTNKQTLLNIIYNLVLEAERQLGNGTGSAKFRLVFALFYEKVPSYITFWVSEKMLIELIELALSTLKADIEKNNNIRKLVQ